MTHHSLKSRVNCGKVPCYSFQVILVFLVPDLTWPNFGPFFSQKKEEQRDFGILIKSFSSFIPELNHNKNEKSFYMPMLQFSNRMIECRNEFMNERMFIWKGSAIPKSLFGKGSAIQKSLCSSFLGKDAAIFTKARKTKCFTT